jgi:hypothetical protein
MLAITPLLRAAARATMATSCGFFTGAHQPEAQVLMLRFLDPIRLVRMVNKMVS